MKTFDQIYAESAKNATLTVGYTNKAGELRATSFKTDEQGSVVPWASLAYDGDSGVLSLGDHQMGLPGRMVMGVAGAGAQSVLLDSATSTLALGGRNAGNGTVRLQNRLGTESVVLSGESAMLTLGAKTTATNETSDGKIVLAASDGSQTVVLNGKTGNLTLGGGTQDGDLIIKTASGANAIVMEGSQAAVTIGGNGLKGDLHVKEDSGADTILLDGANGHLTLGGGTTDGDLTIKNSHDKASIVLSGSDGMITVGGDGVNGDIVVRNDQAIETIRITGSNGDIEFLNADVAEEFDVAPGQARNVNPGTVVVLEDSGRLVPCTIPYDPHVVGIVAGASRLRPGIVLDRTGGPDRRAVALMGKTYCRVDANAGPIRVGDMLTTSPTAGHAMRASDRQLAFGSVIGKALEPWPVGLGLIQVLVKPQ